MFLIFLQDPPAERWWVEYLLRGRKIWKAVVLNRLIWWLSGSRVSHVLSSDGEVAIWPHRTGDAFYPHSALGHMPKLWKIFEVPDRTVPPRVPGGLYDFDRVARPKRRAWRSLACRLTFGLIRSEDCVQVAKAMLADHGHRIPRRITTPIALYRHLRRQDAHR